MQSFLVGLLLAIRPWITAALVGLEVEPPQHHGHGRHHEVESHLEQSPHGKLHGKHHVHVEQSVVRMLNHKRYHSEVEQQELPPADEILANMDAKRSLPEHGFSGKPVAHKNAETYTSDWRREFGPRAHGETSVREICARYPDSSWCRKKGFHHYSRGVSAKKKKNDGHSGDSQHSDSHSSGWNDVFGSEGHSGGHSGGDGEDSHSSGWNDVFGSEGHSSGRGGGDSEDSHSSGWNDVFGGGGDKHGKHGERGSHGEHGEKEWHEDVLPNDANPFGSDPAGSSSSGHSSEHGSHGSNDGSHKSQGGSHSHGTNDGSDKSQGGDHGEYVAPSSAQGAPLRTLLALAAACQLLWAA